MSKLLEIQGEIKETERMYNYFREESRRAWDKLTTDSVCRSVPKMKREPFGVRLRLRRI
jgi:hypothetical protein